MIVYRKDFCCEQLSLPVSFPSFELSVSELGLAHPVLYALIYRPPKYNKDFINYFSDFLAEIVPKYDRILTVGDLNIHVCCPNKPMVKHFLDLVDSFNLLQSVAGPAHEHRHTLRIYFCHVVYLLLTWEFVMQYFLIICLSYLRFFFPVIR